MNVGRGDPPGLWRRISSTPVALGLLTPADRYFTFPRTGELPAHAGELLKCARDPWDCVIWRREESGELLKCARDPWDCVIWRREESGAYNVLVFFGDTELVPRSALRLAQCAEPDVYELTDEARADALAQNFDVLAAVFLSDGL